MKTNGSGLWHQQLSNWAVTHGKIDSDRQGAEDRISTKTSDGDVKKKIMTKA